MRGIAHGAVLRIFSFLRVVQNVYKNEFKTK